MSERQAIILCMQGGKGDVCASTSAVRAFRNKFPKDEFELIIVTPHPDMYFNNPNVDNLLSMGVREDMEEVYNKYIYGDTKIKFYKSHFLYDSFCDEIKKQSKTLPEFICRLYNINYDGKPLDFFSTAYEINGAKAFMSQFSKPVILLHITGTLPLKSIVDLSIIQKIVDNYKEKYNFLQVGAQGEPLLNNVKNGMNFPIRHTAAVMKYTKANIILESVFAHISNALQLNSTVVIFQSTDYKFFGYSNHFNVYDNTTGGLCPSWPCNAPIGPLGRHAPAFLDLTSGQPLPFLCPNHLCAKIDPALIEAALLEAIAASDEKEKQKAESGPFDSLETARKAESK